MALLFEVEFGSFLVYSPKGIEPKSKISRVVRDAIKGDRSLDFGGQMQRAIPYYVAALKTKLSGTVLEELFIRKPVLVPAPRSSLMVPNSLYPTRVICDQMVAKGLGSVTRLSLERTKAVPKAAFQKSDERPTVQQHYDSLRVNADMVEPDEIVIVDDIVTRGTMFLASATRLNETYPKAKIRAFALIRTMSGQEIPRIVEICKGSIYRRDAWGCRRP